MAQETGGAGAGLRADEAVFGDQPGLLEVVAVGGLMSRPVHDELGGREGLLAAPVRLYVVGRNEGYESWARLSAGPPRLDEAPAASLGVPDMRGPLGRERAALLTDVLSYRAEHGPAGFRDAVHAAVGCYASALALVTPASEADGAGTVGVAEGVLAGYAARLAGDASLARPAGRAFHELVNRVVTELRVEHDEPVFRTESRPVYRREPVYTECTETDCTQPIIRSVRVTRRRAPENPREVLASIGNWWRGKRFGVYSDGCETETIGYRTKWVSEITGYRDVLDHTESYQVRAGTRKALAGYRPFAGKGTALGLTAWYLALQRTAGKTRGDAASVYREVLANGRAGGPPGAAWLPADAGQLLDSSLTAGLPAGACGSAAGECRRSGR
jgi:hypothetical protein